jgi:hypothetical protein
MLNIDEYEKTTYLAGREVTELAEHANVEMIFLMLLVFFAGFWFSFLYFSCNKNDS